MNFITRLIRTARIFVTVALTLQASQVMADDDFDLEKVAMCVACHGADGIGKAAQYPNLQGQQVDYTVKQLEAFKSGLRKDSTMNRVAKPLSGDDMRMLAVFFNQVK